MCLVPLERQILIFREEWSLPRMECHQDEVVNLKEGAQTFVDNPVRLSLMSIKGSECLVIVQLILSEGKADNTDMWAGLKALPTTLLLVMLFGMLD